MQPSWAWGGSPLIFLGWVACSSSPAPVPSEPAALASAGPVASAAAPLASASSSATASASAAAPDAPPRRVQVSFEDLPAGAGKREVFAVVADLQLRRSLGTYEEPGACVLDPEPFRPEVPLAPGERGRRRKSRALPPGRWLRCGVLEAASVGIGFTPQGLVINDDVVPIPPGIAFDWPAEAPVQGGLPPCAAGTVGPQVTASIAVETVDARERIVWLSIPALKQKIEIARLPEAGNCTSVLSERWGWLQHECRSGVRWQHHSSDTLMVRPVGNRLLLGLVSLSTDLSHHASGAIALPCGARVSLRGKTIRETRGTGYPACMLSCYAPVGACEDRCLRKFGTEEGGPSDDSAPCSQACTDRSNDCLVRCFR